MPAQPLDGNYRPIAGDIYDPVGNQFPVQQASGAVATANGIAYSPALVQLANKNIAVAAGSGSTPIVVKSGPGYLKKIIVTTTATAAMTFYDNATAASGTALYVTGTTIAAGTIVDLDMPFANGLTVSQASGSAAVTLAYI